MARRAVLLLMVLIVLAVGYIVGLIYLSPEQLTQSLPGPTAIIWEPEIVITTVDLPAGTTIPANALTTCVWPVAWTPQRAYVLPRDLIGRKTRVDIPRGMPIIDSQILPGTAVPMTQTAATSPAFQCTSHDKRADVVVASREISPGESISKEDVTVEPWPADEMPPGVIQDVQLVIGKAAKSLIPKGTVILNSQLGR